MTRLKVKRKRKSKATAIKFANSMLNDIAYDRYKLPVLGTSSSYHIKKVHGFGSTVLTNRRKAQKQEDKLSDAVKNAVEAVQEFSEKVINLVKTNKRINIYGLPLAGKKTRLQERLKSNGRVLKPKRAHM